MYADTYIHLYVYIYMDICMYYVYIYTHTDIHAYIHILMHMRLYVYMSRVGQNSRMAAMLSYAAQLYSAIATYADDQITLMPQNRCKHQKTLTSHVLVLAQEMVPNAPTPNCM